MKLSLKALLVAAIVLMAVMPGAYGINIQVAGGNQGTTDSVQYGFKTNIATAVTVTVNGVPQSSGTQLDEGPITITGTFSKFTHDRHVTDGQNNHAEVHTAIINGQNLINYLASIYPVGGPDVGYVTAEQSFSVGQSDSIKCSQSASNAAGDKASSSLKVEYGSLSNYWGGAGADFENAAAWQGFEEAFGSSINAKEMASNRLGGTVTTTDIFNGGIGGYGNVNDMPNAVAWGDGGSDIGFFTGRMAYGMMGEKISLESSASTLDKSSASSKTTIKNGGLSYYGSLSAMNYPYIPVPGLTSFQMFDIMGGQLINIGESASNSLGDKVKVNAEIQNGQIQSITDNPYVSAALAIPFTGDMVAGQGGISGPYGYPAYSVTGSKLTLTASAKNALTGQEASQKTVAYNPANQDFYNLAGVLYSIDNPYVPPGTPPGTPFVVQGLGVYS